MLPSARPLSNTYRATYQGYTVDGDETEVANWVNWAVSAIGCNEKVFGWVVRVLDVSPIFWSNSKERVALCCAQQCSSISTFRAVQ